MKIHETALPTAEELREELIEPYLTEKALEECGVEFPYGGVTDAPMASGAQAMLLAWQEKEQYYPVGTYRPVSGDVVFLDVSRNGTPEKTAIVSEVGNDGITVIEGDQDGGVAEVEYFFPSESVVGYAAPSLGNNLLVLDTDPTSADTVIANAVTYTESMLADNLFILYTQGSDGNYYAMDGNGGAVRIDVSAAGEVTSSLSDPTTLYWAFAYQGTYQSPITATEPQVPITFRT